ncbi:MAG: hypothetical protein LUH43_07360 [Clostridia bacterium]|nr:hypothetical protein [Clostridia bacterium]
MTMKIPYGRMNRVNVPAYGVQLFSEHRRIRGPPQSKGEVHLKAFVECVLMQN